MLSLDSKLTSLIESLRSRIRRYVIWDSVLALALVLLAAFWIGLAVDFLPVKLGGTEMPRSARVVMLSVVAAVMLLIVARLLIGRLRRPLPDDSLALLVERQHPSLGGRLVTAIQLGRAGREGDSHDPALLQHVLDEAAANVDDVDPSRVFRRKPLVQKAAVVAPLLIATVGLLIASPQTFARAASRLTLLSDDPWPRRARLEMIGVELPRITADENENAPPMLIPFQDRQMRLPRGSDATLRIQAKADEDAVVPSVCTAYYRTDQGNRGQANLRRVGREMDGFQAFVLDGPPLAGLSESMTISVHGLDDRLEDFRIEAVEPPAITRFDVKVRYPNYLRDGLPTESSVDDLSMDYQSGVRIREGSRVTLSARSSVALGEVDFAIEASGKSLADVTPKLVDDGMTAEFRLNDFGAATTLKVVPIDRDGISAQAPYRYFFSVIRDQPPEVKLRLQGIGSAVTPIANLPIRVTATDDYGIVSTGVELAVSGPPGENAEAEVTELSVWSPDLDRDGEAQGGIDLLALTEQEKLPELQPGGSINVFAEAADGFDLSDPHSARSEVFRLEIVTADQLLALLERRELGLRSRLEQTIDETRSLREAISRLDVEVPDLDAETAPPADSRDDSTAEADETGAEGDADRQRQILRLRVQQAGLQAAKTSEELNGIVAALADLLQEMVNNRVDSVDRRERIGANVRDPLVRVIDGDLTKLRDQIRSLEEEIGSDQQAELTQKDAVATADEVLLQLTAVLEKMLDLESFNEILDLVRGLIGDQEELLEETKEEQKKRIKDFFEF